MFLYAQPLDMPSLPVFTMSSYPACSEAATVATCGGGGGGGGGAYNR